MFLPGPGSLMAQPRVNAEAAVTASVTIRLLASTGVGK